MRIEIGRTITLTITLTLTITGTETITKTPPPNDYELNEIDGLQEVGGDNEALETNYLCNS